MLHFGYVAIFLAHKTMKKVGVFHKTYQAAGKKINIVGCAAPSYET